MADMTPEREALLLETGMELRAAIRKRDELLAQATEVYDKAAEQDDKRGLISGSVMLMLMAAVGDDRVQNIVRNFTSQDKLLSRADS